MTTAPAPLLAAHDVSAAYDGRTVLDRVSLSLARGSRMALLGPNGAGKTTLLQVLGGVLQPRAGRVDLAGQPLSAWSPRDRARTLAAVPQTIGAPVPLSVADVAATGRLPHLGDWLAWGERDDAAVRAALEAVELTAFRDRTLDCLSAGERQRAWLAMALAQEPEVLLLDEPSAHLDVHHAWKLMALIVRLAADRNLGVIFSTHDLNLAASFATEIVLLQAGAVAARGRPDEVLQPDILSRVYGHPMRVARMDDQIRVWPA